MSTILADLRIPASWPFQTSKQSLDELADWLEESSSRSLTDKIPLQIA
ncbi:hypothetical protein [Streptococcus mitis]|nr:hypothetical protein [Streptococcus mitis]